MSKYVERGRVPPHLISVDDPPAVVLIKDEHQMFRALFDLADEAEGRALVMLSSEICVRLAIHMSIEEDVLYPALRRVVGAEPIDEGIVEHELTRSLVVDVARLRGEEEMYKAKVHVLGEETMHHIDEEDRELLSRARDAWRDGKIDLVALCGRLNERRRLLYQHIAALEANHWKSNREPDVGDDQMIAEILTSQAVGG
jgi:hemerythrin-like domain-containing protein